MINNFRIEFNSTLFYLSNDKELNFSYIIKSGIFIFINSIKKRLIKIYFMLIYPFYIYLHILYQLVEKCSFVSYNDFWIILENESKLWELFFLKKR